MNGFTTKQREIAMLEYRMRRTIAELERFSAVEPPQPHPPLVGYMRPNKRGKYRALVRLDGTVELDVLHEVDLGTF